MSQKVIRAFRTIVVLAILICVGYWIMVSFYAVKHGKIAYSPLEIVELLEKSGYTISAIQEHDQSEIGGRYGEIDEFLSVEIDSEHVLIFSYSTWETAHQATKILNRLSKRWGDGNGYSFHYGRVVISVESESKDFGKVLIQILDKRD